MAEHEFRFVRCVSTACHWYEAHYRSGCSCGWAEPGWWTMETAARCAWMAHSAAAVSADVCAIPIRHGSTKHAWLLDGDNPYIVCSTCGQRRQLP